MNPWTNLGIFILFIVYLAFLLYLFGGFTKTTMLWLLIFVPLFIWLIFASSSCGPCNSVSVDSDLDESESDMKLIEESEPKQIKLPGEFELVEHGLSIGDATANVATLKGGITYAKLKDLIHDKNFVTKYAAAMRNALILKKDRLNRVLTQTYSELKALNNGSLDNGFKNLFKANEDIDLLQMIINKIKGLIEEIKAKYHTITDEKAFYGLRSSLFDHTNGMETLIGREDVKNFLAVQIYTFANNPRVFLNNFQNIVISGDAGIGKTKLAQVIGHVYASSGILVRNHVQITTKKNFTTPYVNESARMTSKLLMSCLESVVFIDEAYDLTPAASAIFGQNYDHGNEAIAELVNFTDKMIGVSVIIAAGYQKEMESRFLNANEGMRRRFPHNLKLTGYDSKSLTVILLRFMGKIISTSFSKDDYNYIFSLVNYINDKRPDVFKNQAGDMENLSSSISKAIYASPGLIWEKDSQEIIKNGFNIFLTNKGICLDGEQDSD